MNKNKQLDKIFETKRYETSSSQSDRLTGF